MKDIIKQMFYLWYSNGGDLFNYYNDVGGFSIYGSWGSIENMTVNLAQSPKYQVLFLYFFISLFLYFFISLFLYFFISLFLYFFFSFFLFFSFLFPEINARQALMEVVALQTAQTSSTGGSTGSGSTGSSSTVAGSTGAAQYSTSQTTSLSMPLFLTLNKLSIYSLTLFTAAPTTTTNHESVASRDCVAFALLAVVLIVLL
jgi:hypothetical protein